MNFKLIVAGLIGFGFAVLTPDFSEPSDIQAVLSPSSDAEACGVKVAVKAAPPKRNLKKRTARKPVNRGGTRVAVRKKVDQKSDRKPVAVGPSRLARTPKRNKRPAANPDRVAVADKVVEDEPDETEEPEAEEEVAEPEPKAKKISKKRPSRVEEVSAPKAEVVASGAGPTTEIYFDMNESTLSEENREALAEQIAWLKDNPSGKLIIEGHTDPVGSSTRNKRLSVARANAVRAFLAEEASVEDSRLEVVGRGEAKLRYRRSSPKNRRVLIRSAR